MMKNLRLLLALYYRPLKALGGILDEGSLLFGAVAATAAAVLLQVTVASAIYRAYEAVYTPPRRILLPQSRPASFQPGVHRAQSPSTPEDESDEEDGGYAAPSFGRRPLPLVGNAGWWFVSFRPLSYFTIVLSLAVLYVPGTLLALALVERGASFRVRLQRDYAALLACVLTAWAAAHLPFALAGLALDVGADAALLLWLGGNLYFGGLMVAALTVVSGARLAQAMIAVGVSWVAMGFDSWLYALATFSPFLTVIWLLPLALGAYVGLSGAYRQRQRFRRNLETATVNPRDSESHYQLGLLHQQRRQYDEAAWRFRQAVEIDPRETDAHFQLGRIAREQGRLQEAIDHFGAVVGQDDKHAQSEVWREVGATYLAAAMYDEARSALERYIERRPFDPEGLYYLGETFRLQGQAERAREVYGQCVEAAKTMPYYRRSQAGKWAKLAQNRLAERA